MFRSEGGRKQITDRSPDRKKRTADQLLIRQKKRQTCRPPQSGKPPTNLSQNIGISAFAEKKA